jgi:hypothetical protein
MSSKLCPVRQARQNADRQRLCGLQAYDLRKLLITEVFS